MGLVSELGNRFKSEFVAQVVSTVSGALLVLLLARLLEPSGYGLLFLAISIFSVGKLFSRLGLAKSAARYVSEYRERDPRQIPHIIKRSFAYNLVTTTIVAVVFIIGSEYIAVGLQEPDLIPFFTIGVLYVVFGTLVTYVRSVAQGFEDIQLAATVLAVDRGLRLIFAVGFVALGFGAVGALGGFVVGSFAGFLLGIVALYNRHYREIQSADVMDEGLARRILEYNVPLAVTGLSGRIDKQLDTILVGFFLNPVAVSFYVIGKQIAEFVQMPSNALGFAISPTYGKQKAGNELQKAARMFETSLSYTLLLYIPAAVGIFFVAEPTIEIFFGDGYLGAVPVVQVLTVYVVLAAITNISDNPLDYLGRAKARAIAKGVASVSNVILNILLIPTIGIVGAAIATVTTHSFYVGVKLYVIYIELPLDLSKLVSDVMSIALIVIGMSIFVWLFSQHISGIVTLALVVFTGVMIWGLLSILTDMLDPKVVTQLL